MPTGQVAAVADTVRLLTALGWPPEVAHASVEYVIGRLIDIGDRVSAYDVLRRDKSARAMFDLPRPAWIGLLRMVLGHPGAPTRDGRHGLLARLLIGDTVEDLLADGDVVQAATTICPMRVVTADG